MSKPYFAYENLIPNAAVTARTGSSAYPASNLTKHRLWPGYRSADQCLVLNGMDEYAYVADHADFDITGDLTIEAVVEPTTLPLQARIMDKWNGQGFIFEQRDGNLAFTGQGPTHIFTAQTNTMPLTISTVSRVNCVYKASAPELVFYKDGVEIARINNSMQTGGSLNGTIDTSLTTNAERVTIGAGAGGAILFSGNLAYVGIANTEHDNGGYLNPSGCVGYWNFEGDLTDSSGNGHTLTGVSIDSTNYADCTAYQWIVSGYSSNQFPTYCFIDRRHNLSTGATVSLLRLYQFSNYTVVDSATVTAGEPIVFDVSGGGQTWWLEIHDPDNPDGYIEIPYVYLGSKTDLSRGFLRGFRHSERRHGNLLADSVGGYTGYVRSEQLWEADLRLRALPGDFATVQSVASVANQGRPFVFSEDGSAANTRLVYWPDAMEPGYTHNVDTQNFVDLQLREAGGGL